jgi:hypothetical protein
MLKITLDRQHTMHLEMHNWVRVDDYIIIQEYKGEYLFAKLVDGEAVECTLDAQICQVILKEEN